VEELDVSQVWLDRDRVNLQKAGRQVTKKRRPIVPIFPEQRETLERLVCEAKGGWLFGRGRFNSYHPFRRLCKDCGFEEDRQHPHMLRHSRATHLLMEGVPLSKVATLLGDSLQTVEANYWHPSPDFLTS
jgi:integrase